MLKHKRFALDQARTYYKNPVKSSPVQETGDDLSPSGLLNFIQFLNPSACCTVVDN